MVNALCIVMKDPPGLRCTKCASFMIDDPGMRSDSQRNEGPFQGIVDECIGKLLRF